MPFFNFFFLQRWILRKSNYFQEPDNNLCPIPSVGEKAHQKLHYWLSDKKKEYYNEREQIPEDIWDTFSRELLYYPEDEELFSVSGCRRVPDKTQYVMDDF